MYPYNISVKPDITYVSDGIINITNIKVSLIPKRHCMSFELPYGDMDESTTKELSRGIRDEAIKSLATMIYDRLDIHKDYPPRMYPRETYCITALEEEDKSRYLDMVKDRDNVIIDQSNFINSLNFKIRRFKSLGFWKLLGLAFNFKGRKNDTCYSW